MYGFMLKKKKEQNRNDEKYNQSGKLLKFIEIMTVSTEIMLRSIAVNSSRQFPAFPVKQASEITLGAL